MADQKVVDFKVAAKALKLQQQNHVAKLQLKSDADVELLEVIRDYMQKRSEIENQYSKGVERLGKNVLQRKFRKYVGPGPAALSPGAATTPTSPVNTSNSALQEGHDNANEDSASARSPSTSIMDTYHAFAVLVSESETQARARAQVSEKLVSNISDFIKDFNKEKNASTKKNMDFCIKYQQDLWVAYEELDKLKLTYEKSAKEADAAQKKYEDAVKRPKSGLQALKNLVTGKDAEERIQRLKSKWKSKTRQLNDSRNDYLLALSGTNALQTLYYNEDMTTLMKKLDGEYYPTLAKMLKTYTDLEMSLSISLKTSVDHVNAEVVKIDRSRDVDIFLKEFAQVFQDPREFSFDCVCADEIREIVVDDVTKTPLGRRLGELLVRDESISSIIAQREKELSGVAQIAETYANTPQFGNAASPIEQMHDLQNAIDLLKAQRTRLTTQIKALKSANVEPIAPPPEERPELPTLSNAVKQNMSAVAVSDHTPSAADEISLSSGDAIEIVTPDADGRTRVRIIATGVVGFVSSACVKVQETLHGAQTPSSNQIKLTVTALKDYEATDEGELSFKAGDIIECLDGLYADEEWWDGRVVRTGQLGTFPVEYTAGWENVAAASVGRTKMTRGLTARRAPSTNKRALNMPSAATELKVQCARALYSYEATCEGELSIECGEIITLTSMDTGSDAWWEGEGRRGRGQFPVNYVRLLDDAAASKEIKSSGKLLMSNVSEVAQVRALYDFTSTAAGELSFKAGDIIVVIQSTDPDWWDGDLDGQIGAFPVNYVERI